MAEFSFIDRSSSPETHNARLFGYWETTSDTTSDPVAATAVSPASPPLDSSGESTISPDSINPVCSQIKEPEDCEEYDHEVSIEYIKATYMLEFTSSFCPIQISELFKPVVCTNDKSYFESIAHAIRDAPARRLRLDAGRAILELMSLSSHNRFRYSKPIMANVTSNNYATDVIRDHHFRLNELNEFHEPRRTSQFLQACTENENRKIQSTVVKSMREGFQNADFERSVRQNAKKPTVKPYWITGTEYALGKWTTSRMFDRMKSANLRIIENVEHLADEHSLEEALSIFTGGVSKLTDSLTRSQFCLSDGFGNTIRKFVGENRQFLINIVLNNELQEMVLPAQFDSAGAGILTTDFWDSNGCTEVVRVFTKNSTLHAFPDEPVNIKENGESTKGSKSIGTIKFTDTQDSPNITFVPEPRGKNYDRNLRRRENRKVSKDLVGSISSRSSNCSPMRRGSPLELVEHTKRSEAADTEAFPNIYVIEDNTKSDDGDALDQGHPVLQVKSGKTAESQNLELPVVNDQEQDCSKTLSKIKLSSRIESKSMDSTSGPVLDRDLNSAISKLRSETIPDSLEESGNRRASVNRERRDSINLIRSRTASRVSNSGIQLQAPPSSVLHDEQFAANDNMERLFTHSTAVQGQNLIKIEDSNTFEHSIDLMPLSISGLHSVDEEPGDKDAKPTSTSFAPPARHGKWIAPLPEDQDWKTLDRVSGYALPPQPAKSKIKKSKKKAGKLHGTIAVPQTGPLLDQKTLLSRQYEMGTMISNSVELGLEKNEVYSPSPIPPNRASAFASDARANDKSILADTLPLAVSQVGTKELRDDDNKAKTPAISKQVAHSGSLMDSLVDAGVSESALKSLMSSDPLRLQTSQLTLQTTSSPDTKIHGTTVNDLTVDSEMPHQQWLVGLTSSSAGTLVDCVPPAPSNCPLATEMEKVSESTSSNWDIEAIMNDRLQYPQHYPFHGPIFRSHKRSESTTETGGSNGQQNYIEDANEEDETQIPAPPRSHSAMGQLSTGSLRKASTACGAAACLHCIKQASSSFTTDISDISNLQGHDARELLGNQFPKALTIASHPQVNRLFQKGMWGKCEYCDSKIPDIWEIELYESVICPGCGPCSDIRYCTASCLLADALDHQKICGTKSADFPMDWINAPKRFHNMMPPIQPLDGKFNAEWFRQRQYSMICNEEVVHNPLQAFFYYKISEEKRAQLSGHDNWTPYSGLEPGDYFIFFPAPPEKIPDRVNFVIFTVTFPDHTNHKIKFNRALNAAFLTGDTGILTFVFDAIHSRIDDDVDLYYHTMDNVRPRGRDLSAAEKMHYIHTVFNVQFFKEFDFHAPLATGKFDFDTAFNLIFAKVADLEFQHPILRAWWRGDPTKSPDPWIRFKGSDWVAQLLRHYGPEEWDRVTDVVKGDLSLFGPGYTGQDAAVWQKHLNDLHLAKVQAALQKIGIYL